jgi:hypothetical protein
LAGPACGFTSSAIARLSRFPPIGRQPLPLVRSRH